MTSRLKTLSHNGQGNYKNGRISLDVTSRRNITWRHVVSRSDTLIQQIQNPKIQNQYPKTQNLKSHLSGGILGKDPSALNFDPSALNFEEFYSSLASGLTRIVVVEI